MKRLLFIFIWCSAVIAQAVPGPKIIPFVGLHRIPHHSIKAQTRASVAPEAFADFTGEWVGHCHVKEGDVDDETTNDYLRIENNAHWIKIFDNADGSSDEYDIGKDLSEHEEHKNGFSVFHQTFNWINASTLLFNFIEIDNQQFPDLTRSIDGTLARVSWTLKHDTLIVHMEVQHLENEEDSFHTTGTCEYVRQ